MSIIQLRKILIFVLYFHQEKLEVFGIEKQYIGCYVDQSERTLPYERIDLRDTMTNDICASHCCSALDGATYSGSGAWYVCFCSNVTNTDNFVLRDPATGKDCDMVCDGNQNEMCGGDWSLSVYRIDCSTDTTVTSKTLTLSEKSTLTIDYTPTNSDKSKVATTNSPIISDKSTVTTTSSPTTSDVSTVTTNDLQTTRYISTVITEITTESPKPVNSQSTSEKTQLWQIIKMHAAAFQINSTHTFSFFFGLLKMLFLLY